MQENRFGWAQGGLNTREKPMNTREKTKNTLEKPKNTMQNTRTNTRVNPPLQSGQFFKSIPHVVLTSTE